MFCEKCGNKMADGVRFCEKCGNPVNAPQPVQAPVQQQAQTPPAEGQAPAGQPQYAPPQGQYMPPQGQAQYMPPQAPKPPRKPLSPKVKKIILFSGIGAVVLTVGLILLFAVIIPEANKVDISKYVTVAFDSQEVYDGDISGYAAVSAKNLYIDKLGDEEAKKQAESEKKLSDGSYSYNDLYNDLSSYSSSSGSYAKKAAVTSIVGALEVECKIKDQEESTTGESESKASSANSAKFENAKKIDTLVVTIKWPTDEFERKELEQQESLSGLRFDKSDKTVEIKLEDKIKDSKVTVKDKVEVDFVKVINDKNLVNIIGTPGNYPKAELAEFEYTQGDYKFTNAKTDEKSSHDYNKVVVTNAKDSESETSFYVSFASVSEASEGDEIAYTINNENEQLRKTDVFFKDTKGTFKYAPNHPLTLDEAKKNVSKIVSAVTEDIKSIDSSIKDSRNFSVAEVDYVTSKEDADKEPLVYIYYKNSSTNKYKYIEVTHSYIRGEDFFYGRANDSWSTYESLEKCKESSDPFSKYSADKYTATKIQ